MFKQGCYNKVGYWSKFLKGLVLGFFLYLTLTAMLFIIGGCAEDLDNEVVEEEAAVEEQEEKIAILKEELAEQEEKIEVLAKAGWSYELLANNQKIFENGYLYIEEPDLDIVFRETMPPYYDLYVEEFNQGALENVADHVNLLIEEKLYKKTAADGTTVSDVPVAYFFEDLEPGDVIELEVSKELQERMHLETEVVTIEKR